MNISRTTEEFLDTLERHAGRKLEFRADIAELIQWTGESMKSQLLDEAVFQAKFLVKTQEVMRRIGSGAVGFDKLSAEFAASLEKTLELLRTLVKDAPSEWHGGFEKRFLTMNQESVSDVLKLCSDLSAIKNWQLDDKPMPYAKGLVERQSTPSDSAGDLRFARSAAVLSLLILAAYASIEQPLTIAGWALAIVLAVLIASVIYFVSHSIHHHEHR
ncbi:MAG: hypothetical protein HY966_07960 [Ignavibacteriales bacterium]|nr:hypothetical protein [Ignavibacteriales bacterium]